MWTRLIRVLLTETVDMVCSLHVNTAATYVVLKLVVQNTWNVRGTVTTACTSTICFSNQNLWLPFQGCIYRVLTSRTINSDHFSEQHSNADLFLMCFLWCVSYILDSFLRSELILPTDRMTGRYGFFLNLGHFRNWFFHRLLGISRSQSPRILFTCCIQYTVQLGTWCRSWLRHCATSRKVESSIPDGVNGIFHWHKFFDRTMALRSTQPLTELSTGNISWRVKAVGA
jgi:hypothetical protein